MQACEQFGGDRAREIDELIKAATGVPCPGRISGVCPFASAGAGGQKGEPHLSVVAS